MKTYQTPSIRTIDALSFETVCANSGTGSVCSWAGRTSVDPNNLNACIKCFNTNLYDAADDYGTMQGGGWTASSITAYLNAGNTCPEGNTL